jgi:hypothetical protein
MELLTKSFRVSNRVPEMDIADEFCFEMQKLGQLQVGKRCGWMGLGMMTSQVDCMWVYKGKDGPA